MAITRGHEVATIDVALVTLQFVGETDELALNTATQIQVAAQTEVVEAIKLMSKGRLVAQKPQQTTLTGNQITLTDCVFNVELVQALQGGTITTDDSDQKRVTGYTPPIAGSTEKGKVFTLNAYSSIYNAAGILTGYEKISYPNCQGTPINISSQDDTFRTPEYTINSAPDTSEPPFTMAWIAPSEFPALPAAIIPATPTGPNP